MKMKKRLPIMIAVSLISLGVVLAIVFTSLAAPDDTPPETVTLTRDDLVITAPVRGNLEMPDKAFLSFGVPGTVEEVLVDVGDTVEKDDELARLDAPSLRLALEAAEAQYRSARNALREANSLLREARDLLGDGGPVTDLLLSFLEQQVDGARSAVEMAELNLESARLNLEQAVITAPFHGVVADINISEGMAFAPAAMGAPPMSMVGTGKIEMRGFIDELDVASVEVGQEATISLDALRDMELKGKVSFVSLIGTVRAGVVSYETIITLEDKHEELRDGMSAAADIIVERRDNVLLIPNRAIRGTREAPLVHVYVDAQVQEREVTLGLSDGIDTEVLSGLNEGEEVVLPGRRT